MVLMPEWACEKMKELIYKIDSCKQAVNILQKCEEETKRELDILLAEKGWVMLKEYENIPQWTSLNSETKGK